jgi:hypothetical protein
MDLSEYILEPLHKDKDFTWYRGQHRYSDQAARLPILLVAPETRHCAPANPRQNESDDPLGSDFEMASVVRPIGVVQYDGQPVLVLENSGGESLEALIRDRISTEQFLSNRPGEGLRRGQALE